MVEETLVGLAGTGQLSVSSRTIGGRIIDDLERRHVEITAAFWSFVDDAETWRLIIATPLTDSEGPLYVYSQLQYVLQDLFPKDATESSAIELADIAVIGPNARIIADLRRQYGTVQREDNRRVRRTEGPYIYRLFEQADGKKKDRK